MGQRFVVRSKKVEVFVKDRYCGCRFLHQHPSTLAGQGINGNQEDCLFYRSCCHIEAEVPEPGTTSAVGRVQEDLAAPRLLQTILLFGEVVRCWNSLQRIGTWIKVYSPHHLDHQIKDPLRGVSLIGIDPSLARQVTPGRSTRHRSVGFSVAKILLALPHPRSDPFLAPVVFVTAQRSFSA